MSDRPTGTNGKRNRAWGSLLACPACGRCLCFSCHPQGPCLDEHEAERALPADSEWRPGAARADRLPWSTSSAAPAA